MAGLKGTPRRPGGTLLLGIDLAPLPEAVAFRGRMWAAKEEFHVTLIGNEGLQWLVRELGSMSVAAVEGALNRAADGIDFFVTLRDDFREVHEGDARTIIRMADVAGAEEFFARMEKELELRIERPPYHVTLLCVGTEKGIGIRTTDHLDRCARRLSAAETDELKAKLFG